MIRKVKRFFKKTSKKLAGAAMVVTSALGTVSASASGGDTTGAVASMTTAFGSIKDDMLSTISAVAPFALAVVGAVVLWKFGIKFFKSIAK